MTDVKKGKVLVTGAAGFIAFHLIESFLRDGQEVVGLDNFDPYYPRPLKETNLADLRRIAADTKASFEFFEMDFRKGESLDSLPQEITSVVHLGAKAGVRPSLENPVSYIQANLEGTVSLLEWSRRRSITEFVFGSSSSVYGNDTTPPFSEDSLCVQPISPYAATKRSGELLCSTYSHLYGFKITSLRFFTVYGPRQRPDLVIRKFIESLLDNRPITLFGDGSTARDYTFVKDIVAGIRRAHQKVLTAKAPFHEIYNLGGHKTTSLLQLVRLIEKYTEKTAEIRWDEMQPGDVRLTYANIDKSARDLGYNPQTSIEEGLQEAVKYQLTLRASKI
jgi:UDP-glucuronate 4-epimerase